MTPEQAEPTIQPLKPGTKGRLVLSEGVDSVPVCKVKLDAEGGAKVSNYFSSLEDNAVIKVIDVRLPDGYSGICVETESSMTWIIQEKNLGDVQEIIPVADSGK